MHYCNVLLQLNTATKYYNIHLMQTLLLRRKLVLRSITIVVEINVKKIYFLRAINRTCHGKYLHARLMQKCWFKYRIIRIQNM